MGGQRNPIQGSQPWLTKKELLKLYQQVCERERETERASERARARGRERERVCDARERKGEGGRESEKDSFIIRCMHVSYIQE